MKRNISKVLAIAMMLALVMSFASLGAFAATTTPYTAAATDKTEFNKYLVVEAGSVVPNVEFGYTIDPGTPIAATSTTMAVLAGPTAGSGDSAKPSVQKAEFTNSSTAYTTLQEGDPEALQGLTYAKDNVEIDFTGVTFPEPGVYRYVLTEETMVSPYSTMDTSYVRYLDVYVVNDDVNAGQLKIASCALHTDDAAPAAGENKGSDDVDADEDPLDTKSDGYINKYNTEDLSFSKEITGNQAAKDKYFKFTVKVTTLIDDEDVFNVDITGADATVADNEATNDGYVGKTNPATVTGAQLKEGVPFYLNNGQHVTIKDLPVGCAYTVEEEAEDYKSTEDNTIVAIAAVEADDTVDPPVAAVPAKLYDDDNSGTLDTDKYVGYTNTREGIIPTGVIITVAPFVIGLLICAAVMLYMISRRRRAEY